MATATERPMGTDVTPATKRAPLVLRVAGKLDVDNRDNRQRLKQEVLDAVNNGQRHIVVDFSEAGYIDASGLGVLVSANKIVRECNGQFVLASLNDDLRELFKLTKLDTLFTIAADTDAGIATLEART